MALFMDVHNIEGGVSAAAFETWLLAQQRHAAAASEAVLHEAALGSMARGALEAAIDYAARAAAAVLADELAESCWPAGFTPGTATGTARCLWPRSPGPGR
jgi:hypothetical protein